jgi:hypothetical protein
VKSYPRLSSLFAMGIIVKSKRSFLLCLPQEPKSNLTVPLFARESFFNCTVSFFYNLCLGNPSVIVSYGTFFCLYLPRQS